ncbi:TPA: HlyD family efflux transporter periplasmic adaptor subunit [Serratia marcescens]
MLSQLFSRFKMNRVAIKEKLKSINYFFFKNEDLNSEADSVDDYIACYSGKKGERGKIQLTLAIVIFFLSFLILWAYISEIDEVSKGNGQVIPSSKEKIIQSMDGGILKRLYVKEGQIVTPGEALVQMDTTRTQASVSETTERYHALLAQQARLKAEVNSTKIVFPEDLKKKAELIEAETRLFESRKKHFEDSLVSLRDSRLLLQRELDINSKLSKLGASSSVDVIRLKKQLVDLNMKEADLISQYYLKSREELSKVSTEISSLSQVILGKNDLLYKSTVRSPVRGIVKNIVTNTIDGVISPNGIIMYIVPLDDSLLIEAKISPRDIAFIRPGQSARIKITAYEYSIYGGLDGEVVTISPDTIKDEQRPDILYYRVYIRTTKDYLEKIKGKRFYISPGMIASVDIRTGSKTILDYLVKPFNKVNEALRER